jgi:cation diffusion facilitator family transporter
MRKLSGPQRTALASVAAAAVLVAIKLIVGLVAHSLGLIAEAIHSATDLVAALLTFFAVGVAGRPADRDHPWGHGKAEHLSALAEGAILVAASIAIAVEAIGRLTGSGHHQVDAHWYVLAVVVVVIVIDCGRSLASRRAAHRHASAALNANALHFTLDMVGSVAVLIGLVLVHAGHPQADSIAALLVAALVLAAAGRLMRRSVQVLMDSAPSGDAESIARRAIKGIEETVTLRRLRMREVGGRHFADVVIGMEPGSGLAHGHAVASAIEDAIEHALPGSDVVVHVEPDAELGQDGTARGPVAVLTLRLAPGVTSAGAEALAEEIEQRVRLEHPDVLDVSVHTDDD